VVGQSNTKVLHSLLYLQLKVVCESYPPFIFLSSFTASSVADPFLFL
jgi:hypothetical protein